MDNVHRDLSRLDLIINLPMGLESFSPAVHVKDFVHYYFTRFMINVTHIFDDFTVSEIQSFHNANTNKLALMIKHPSLQIDATIVPIPKGMINPYKQTLGELLNLLAKVHPQTIMSDLKALQDAMGTGRLKDLTIDAYSKTQFTQTKLAIGKLFGKTGLTHATAKHVLVSKADVKYVDDTLLSVTGKYYPEILLLNPALKAIETKHNAVKWNDADKITLSNHLMTMAYRLSILAAIMDHIQDIEHSFVKCLSVLLKKIS